MCDPAIRLAPGTSRAQREARRGSVALLALSCVAAAAANRQARSAAPVGGHGDTPAVAVECDPRVELFSLLFRLAGAFEYSQKVPLSYVAEAERAFAPFRNHSAVLCARRLREGKGIGFDGVMRLALHVEDAEFLDERVDLDQRPAGLVERVSAEDARALYEEARLFVQDSGFLEFAEAHEAAYAEAAARMRATIEERDAIGWMRRFYGETSRTRVRVIPGLLNGGANYSVTVFAPGEPDEIDLVMGAGVAGPDGRPRFGGDVRATLVHEFGHAFVNPAVAQLFPRLAHPAQALFGHVKKAMESQAYPTPLILLQESVVRAVVVRYVDEVEPPRAGEDEIQEQVRRRFLWTRELARRLEPDPGAEGAPFDSALPKAAGVFEEWAGQAAARRLALGPIERVWNECWKDGSLIVVAPDPPPDGSAAKLDSGSPTRSGPGASASLVAYVEKVHRDLFARGGTQLRRASELSDDEARSRALVLYGSAATNRWVAAPAAAIGLRQEKNALEVGGRRFEGEGLVVITVAPHPLDPSLPAVLYTAADDSALVNVNSILHGAHDFVLARRSPAGAFTVLLESNFERAPDGALSIGPGQ
jgi:hypothetical protein